MNATSGSLEWGGRPAPKELPNARSGPEVIAPGYRIGGRYRLDEVIGRGGMATVYRAYDERLGREVAIKVSRPSPQNPVPPLREERVSSALLHPHLVSIFDAGEIDASETGAGTTYIVMELVDGTTAQAAAPVPWRRAVEIVRHAAQGLAAAHARGIIHCDIKPSNILIDRAGRALVTDFGVAAEAESDVGEYVHGSLAFIAPERLAGARPDPRVDVFGLGGVLAYLMTGRVARDASRLDLPPECPDPVKAVIHRARARDPRARYPDADALLTALENALAEAGNPVSETVTAGDATTRLLGVSPRRVDDPTQARRRSSPQPFRRSVRVRPYASTMVDPPVGLIRRNSALPLNIVASIAVAVGLVAFLTVVVIASGTEPIAADAPPVIIEMPDVYGQSLSGSIEEVSGYGLTIERVDVVYGPGPSNQVVAQDPPAGAAVSSDGAVTLVVRTGR